VCCSAECCGGQCLPACPQAAIGCICNDGTVTAVVEGCKPLQACESDLEVVRVDCQLACSSNGGALSGPDCIEAVCAPV
jgi:hypothetical protein